MSSISIGDMARTFQSRMLTTGLKTDFTRFGKELATGISSDVSSLLSGDFGQIADIERLLTTLSARKNITAEASTISASMQTAFDAIQENSRATSSNLLSLQNNENASTRKILASNARESFEMMTSSLNTHAGGRTLFGGAATDTRAMASSADILAALNLATAAETTATGIASVVDAWFDTPLGGFETVGYLGSTNPMGAFQIGEGSAISVDFRADNQSLRDIMKGFALASLVAEGALSGSAQEQSELLNLAGAKLLASDQNFTTFRAKLGQKEEQIEVITAQNSAQKTSLELMRNSLIAVDPYETASKMEAAYSQLETYYTVTVRLSSLKFTDYMR